MFRRQLAARPSRGPRCRAALVVALAFGLIAPVASAQAPSPGAAGGATDGDWTQFRHDAAHTGSNPDETILSPATVDRLALAWWAPSGFNASPSAADGVVYQGAGDGTLLAYPIDCGVGGAECAPIWHGSTGWIIDWSSPAVADGIVAIGSGQELTAWDIACGTDGAACEPRWSGSSGDIGYSSPAIAEGLLAVGTNSGRLDVYDLAAITAAEPADACATRAACPPLWTADIGMEVHTSPAIVDGVVYIAGQDGRLSAFDAACRTDGGTCTPLWVGETGSVFENSSPTVVDGVVYAGAQDGYLYAWSVGCATDGATCDPVWRGRTRGPIQSSPAVADGIVIIGSLDDRLYAFSVGCRDDGGVCAPIWRSVRTGGDIVSSPAVANGVVYVGSQGAHQADGRLWAFPAAGCSSTPRICGPLWRSESTGALINSSPAVADGRVLIASNDGRLLAFALGGGDTDAPVVTPPEVRFATHGTFGTDDVTVTWGGTDEGSGIAAWRLQQQDLDGRWQPVRLASATVPLARLHLEPGATTRFRVRAVDEAGNRSAWAWGPKVTTELVDDTDARLVASPDAWTQVAATTALGGTVARSETADATLSLAFEGRGVAVIAPRSAQGGVMTVSVDGRNGRSVDLVADGVRSRQLVLRASWAELGSHTVTIAVQGTEGRPRVDIDAIWVLR